MADRFLCIGSYTEETGGSGAGITAFWQGGRTGELTPAGALEVSSPSWLQWHPTLPVLYAANELDAGAVTAVAVDDIGELSVLGSRPTGGATPCHLAVTSDGRHLLAANYGGGSVAVFGLDAGGNLIGRTDLVQHTGGGPDPDRQESAHAHMVVLEGSLASVVDLGTDEIRSYRISDTGTLSPVAVTTLPPGTGPRQLVRAPGTSRAYIVGELAASLIVVNETAAGEFAVVSAVPASARPGPNLPAHLELSPDGRFAYLSNRKLDTLAVFAIDGDKPELVGEHSVGEGWPRHFTIIGSRLYAANQHGDFVVVFDIDQATGALTEIRRYPVGTPVCIAPRPEP